MNTIKLGEFETIERHGAAIRQLIGLSSLGIASVKIGRTTNDNTAVGFTISISAPANYSRDVTKFYSPETIVGTAAKEAVIEWLSPKLPDLMAHIEEAVDAQEKASAKDASARAIAVLTKANQ